MSTQINPDLNQQTRATAIFRLTELARQAQDGLSTLATLRTEANGQLETLVARITAVLESLADRRREFISTFESLADGITTTFTPDLNRAAKDAKVRAVLTELEAQGVDLTAVLKPWGGRRTNLDDPQFTLTKHDLADLIFQTIERRKGAAK
jgi:hypothetical protein